MDATRSVFTLQQHLDVTAASIAPGAHAIMLLDQAGWHGARCLRVPSNISLLPPRSPELNAQENIWQTVCSLPMGPTSPQLSHAECIGGRGRP
jgi:hypothetical protein